MFGIVPYGQSAGPIVQHQPSQAIEQKPPTLWQWYQQLKTTDTQAGPLESAVTGLRLNAESAAISALLGFIEGQFGSLDIGRYPADAIAAALLYALSVYESGKPNGYSADLRALGQSCTSVYLYRTTKRWREAAKANSSAGDMNIHNSKKTPQVDRILEAGRLAGL